MERFSKLMRIERTLFDLALYSTMKLSKISLNFVHLSATLLTVPLLDKFVYLKTIV